MYKLSLDMYQTIACAVVMLYIGNNLRQRIKFLEKFCIPAPLIGGLLFAIISCILYTLEIVEFEFDENLRNVCMVAFFTTVGFQANIKVLKSGGKSLAILLGCLVALIFSQNILAVALSNILGVSPLVGLCAGSISMTGGHGTSGAFGPILESFGFKEATTLCMAAATFGLVAGLLIGGPLGRRLILKYDLLKTAVKENVTPPVEEKINDVRKVSMYAPASYQIAVAMGAGTIVSFMLSKIGMTLPVYIGAMIVAAIMCNISEFTKKFQIYTDEINDIGGICLSSFLSIAMITLKLWQLSELILPLVVLLLGQTLLMFLFARFIIFRSLGADYDAAILAAGTCGFGLGATPNAMVNMQVLTNKFAPSVKSYIIVPIVGGMFSDFINSLIITFFINLV